MPATVYDAQSGDQFGNLDANLRFLEGTGLLRAGARILEIGCGSGRLLDELRARGLSAVGIEPSEHRAASAAARHRGLRLARMSGDALGFEAGTFDLVLSFDVFEHIAASDRHLDEVRRVLRPNGVYALQTPNKWTNSVFETIRWRSFSKWKADHCALHSMRELRHRLTAHGFTAAFAEVPVVNRFYREKLRRYLGPAGPALLRVLNPDGWPLPLRTNFFVVATRVR